MSLAMQRLKHESSRIARVGRAAEVCQELSQRVELLTPHTLACQHTGTRPPRPRKTWPEQSRLLLCWWVGLATA